MKVPCCRTCRNFTESQYRSFAGRCSEWCFGFYRDVITAHPEQSPDIFACGNHQDWEAFREIAGEVNLDEDPEQGRLAVDQGDADILLRSSLTNAKRIESVDARIESLDRVCCELIRKIASLEKSREAYRALNVGVADGWKMHEGRIDAIEKKIVDHFAARIENVKQVGERLAVVEEGHNAEKAMVDALATQIGAMRFHRLAKLEKRVDLIEMSRDAK